MPGNLSLTPSYLKISLIFAVFLLFFSSAMGILEINLVSGLRITVNSQAANNIMILVYRVATIDALLFILFGSLLSVLLPVIRPIKATLLTLFSLVILYVIGYTGMTSYSMIPFEYFMLMILMLYVVNILISYFIEIHRQQKALETFGRYLPPHLVNKISEDAQGVSLQGEARKMTVMFCDIQNFSGISEELNPKQLASLLNEYFTALSKILFNYNATIDKFIGDSVMAFWGAPLHQEDHAQRSVFCALEMIEEINRLSESFIRKGWPGPKGGIGINSGLMAVGNMGSEYRMAYTVIGDAVNIASRVETLTRTYNVPIIVTGNTAESCENILFRELDTINLKGKRLSNRLFQPICRIDNAGSELTDEIKRSQAALEDYYAGKYESAKNRFSELQAVHPDVGYYPVMIRKIENTEANPGRN